MGWGLQPGPLCASAMIFLLQLFTHCPIPGVWGGGRGGLAQSQRRQFGQGLQAAQNSASLAPFQPGKVTHGNQSVPSAPGPEHPKPLSPSPSGWAWHSPAGPGTPQPVLVPAQPILSPGPLEKANVRLPRVQSGATRGRAFAQTCRRMFWKTEGSGLARPEGILCIPQGTAPRRGLCARSLPEPSPGAEGSRALPEAPSRQFPAPAPAGLGGTVPVPSPACPRPRVPPAL